MDQIKATTAQNTMPAGSLNTVFTIKKNKSMTINEFTNKIDCLTNDFTDQSITSKEFKSRILNIMLEIFGVEVDKETKHVIFNEPNNIQS